MGVKGLWKLIENAGVPVPVETLEHKILAVDVSIWLHQAVRGFRGLGGGSVANAHLLTLFHRICKLLFYRVKPVFVFDGGVPHLKKQTLSTRRLKREVASKRANQVRERLLANLLKSKAVRQALGKTHVPSQYHVQKAVTKVEKDMFELPPLPSQKSEEFENDSLFLKSSDSESEVEEGEHLFSNLHEFSSENENFKNLSLDSKHDVLVDLIETRKQNSWATINQMPSESNDFAGFQMERLLKRRKFQATLDNVRSEIQVQKTSEIEQKMFKDLENYVSYSEKIASKDDDHTLFLKKKSTVEKQDKEKPDKGKQIVSKENLNKDFLSEFARQGLINNYEDSDSEDYDDEEIFNNKESVGYENEAILKVINHIVKDDDISQDEILDIIKKSGNEIDHKKSPNKHKSIQDGPSTSSDAPGIIYNPDADSSDDDDDFIEVNPEDCNLSPSKSVVAEPSNDVGANIESIRNAKTNSLYLKIVQQRLDDIIDDDNKSPSKASVDSRRKSLEAKKNLSITLDFNNSEKPGDSDIFSDVFTNNKNVPKKKSLDELLIEEIKSSKDLNVLENKESENNDIETENKINETPVNKFEKSHKMLDLTFPENIKDQLTELVKIEIEKLILEKKDKPQPLSNGIKLSSLENLKEKSKECDYAKVDSSKINSIVPWSTASITNQNSSKHVKDTVANDSNDSEDSDDDDFVEVSMINEESANHNADENIHLKFCNNDHLERTHSEIKEIQNSKVNRTNNFNSANSIKEKYSDSHKDSLVSKINQGSSESLENANNKGNNANNVSKKDSCNVFKPEDLVKSNNIIVDDDIDLFDIDNPDDIEDNQCTNDNFVKVISPQKPLSHNPDDLKYLEDKLEEENRKLVHQVQNIDRVASNLTDNMYKEAQELLQHFGIPYLVAPMEAEAQCGFLDAVGLTDGSITDDSDIFLFGGLTVYKNFFNQDKHVEMFNTESIKNSFGLDRKKLALLAMLSGSDYTVGIEHVGAVSAMEILSEFPGEGIETLVSFKKWWTLAQKHTDINNKTRNNLTHLQLPESFPNKDIFNAYLLPEVDESKEKFSWGSPNIEGLENYLSDKLGWNRSKTDEILLPVIKRMGITETQKTLDSYFTRYKLVKETQHKSKRLQEAIARNKGEPLPTENKLKDLKASCVAKSSKTKHAISKTATTQSESKDVQPISKNNRIPSKRKCDGVENTSVPHKKTKEDAFKALLTKEKILQKEKSLADMREKKLKAALLIKKNKKL